MHEEATCEEATCEEVSHSSTPVLVPDGDKLEQGNWRVGGMRLTPCRAGASMRTCAASNSATIKDYVGNTTEYADHPAASSPCSHEDSSTLPAACSCRAPHQSMSLKLNSIKHALSTVFLWNVVEAATSLTCAKNSASRANNDKDASSSSPSIAASNRNAKLCSPLESRLLVVFTGSTAQFFLARRLRMRR